MAFLHVLHIAGQAKQVGACMFILKAQYLALYALFAHLIASVGNKVGSGLRWTCMLFLRPYFPKTQFFSEDLLDKHMGNHGIVLQVIPYFGISDFVCFHYPAFFHSCTSRCLQPFLIKDECVEVLHFT